MKKNIELQTKGSTSAQISATGVLIIPNGTKTIKQYEYRGNDNITMVVIPRSVTKISRAAFENSTKLSRIKGGDGLKEIGIRAFKGTAIEEIVLPKLLQRLRACAFEECDNLKTVDFDNDNTLVEEGSFSNCRKLQTVMLPMNMNVIPDRLFFGCDNLECVALSPNLKSVGNASFTNCCSLKQFYYYSFAKDHGLEFPNSAISIGDEAFRGCKALTSVDISDSVKSIGKGAFSDCTGLRSVNFGNSVTTVGYGAFENCSSLTRVFFPNGLTAIGVCEFTFCSSLTDVTIPESVTTIAHSAFAGCKCLKKVTIPSSVSHIGHRAFFICSSLSQVTIPNSVTSIGCYTFDGCSGLRQITFEGLTKMDVDHSSLTSCTGLITINVPKEYLETYKEMLPKELHEKLVGF